MSGLDPKPPNFSKLAEFVNVAIKPPKNHGEIINLVAAENVFLAVNFPLSCVFVCSSIQCLEF